MRPARWLLVGSIVIALAGCGSGSEAPLPGGDIPNPGQAVAPISGDQLCDAMSSVGMDVIAGAPIATYTPATLGGTVNAPGGISTCAALSDDPAVGVNGSLQFLASPDNAGMDAYPSELHVDGLGDDAIATSTVLIVLTDTTLVGLNFTPASGYSPGPNVFLDTMKAVLDNLSLAY